MNDKVFLFNERIENEYIVNEIGKRDLVLKKVSTQDINDNLENITVLCPLIKKDKVLRILEACVQMRIARLIFYKSQHSSSGIQFAYDKLRLNAIENLEQSGGYKQIEIYNQIVDLHNLPQLIQKELLVMGCINSDKKILHLESTSHVFCLVGPEGGLSKDEALFLENKVNLTKISLGQRILTSENACIALLAKII